MLAVNAKELAACHRTEFSPSYGWMSRWKSHHNIIFKKKHGEKQAANLQAALDWKADIFPEILQSFKKEDIFNVDETGLYYRGYPVREHCFRGDEL